MKDLSALLLFMLLAGFLAVLTDPDARSIVSHLVDLLGFVYLGIIITAALIFAMPAGIRIYRRLVDPKKKAIVRTLFLVGNALATTGTVILLTL